MQLRDLLLPLILLLVVGMMVFPLHVLVLDFLLVCNITLSLSLLLGSVYLSEPERFTSLPTVLLLATLFRLGLNISTTRQLLGEGTAPDVVAAFGRVVISGNLVVGIVIFLIVTLVQFLVIAKGAERVAEVAARFTLDAMPGKQMSIDADVRAGILSVADARDRRRDLQRESKLYGALDGAMKFVKGDAIAGLVITAVNITAGLAIGTLQRGMTLAEAAYTYSIFTVGDGLVSQIPALLTAVAAGIAVTRVADREGSYVGREALAQLGREPQALAATSAVLCCLACVPGFSVVMFGGMGLLFATFAAQARIAARRGAEAEHEAAFKPRSPAGLSLALSPEAVSVLRKERSLPGQVQLFRQRIFDSLGLLLGDMSFDVVSEPGVCAAVCLHGVRLDVVVTSSGGALGESILRCLAEVVDKHRTELVDDTQTRVLLDIHQASCEDLINSLVPKPLSVTALTRLLRNLVQERVSVRAFAPVLQALAETLAEQDARRADSQRERELLAAARVALRRTISTTIADPGGTAEVWMLSAELDRLLAKAAQSGSVVAPELCEAIEESVEALCFAGRKDGMSEPFTVLATPIARRELFVLLSERFPGARVVAADELVEEIRLIVLGEIALPAPPLQPEPRAIQPEPEPASGVST